MRRLFFISIIFVSIFFLGAMVLVSARMAKYQHGLLAKTKQNVKAAQTEQPANTPQATQSAQASPSPSPYVGYCINVPILMYHHIQPMEEAKLKRQQNLTVDTGTFDSQMNYLKSKGYNTITIVDVATALKNKRGLGKSVVVTLDDGYKDQFTNAFPIAQKYGIKLNLFIPTGLMDNPDYMTWDNLKQMVSSNTAIAYDHTRSHSNVAALTPDKLSYEILTAKKDLEERFGTTQNIFAFPYGNESDAATNFLKSNGFIAAVSTIQGTTQCDSFIMSLHRTRVGGLPLGMYGI